MEERVEFLRERLYDAIDCGNSLDILKASEELDAEIVRIMYKSKQEIH